MFPVDDKDLGEIPGNQDAVLVGCGDGYRFRKRLFFRVCGLRTVAIAKLCLQFRGEPQCYALQQSSKAGSAICLYSPPNHFLMLPNWKYP